MLSSAQFWEVFKHESQVKISIWMDEVFELLYNDTIRAFYNPEMLFLRSINTM